MTRRAIAAIVAVALGCDASSPSATDNTARLGLPAATECLPAGYSFAGAVKVHPRFTTLPVLREVAPVKPSAYRIGGLRFVECGADPICPCGGAP